MEFLDQIIELFSPLSIQGLLFLVWLASFVTLPIIRSVWGPPGERAGTAAGVVSSVLLVTALLVPTHRWWTIAVVVGVPLLGWLSEVVGSRTGVPFGAYHYTDVLQPQLAGVPVLIPLAWLMMMPSSWAVGLVIAPSNKLLQWLVAAVAFTAWDLFVDPQMVSQGYWKWHKRGFYVGIPAVNFLGWFVVALVITAAFGLSELAGTHDLVSSVTTGPFIAIFAATWFLQSVGHLVFWKLPVSGITGMAGMGLFLVVVALRVF